MAHFGTSALLYLWLWEIFHPTPPHLSSHTHFTPFTRTHTIPSYHEQVSYERRNHLRLFRLGLTRVLSFDFVVWMGHLNTIPNCHSGTYSIWGLTISLKIKNFSSWDSWKESVTVRRLQHLLTEATSQKSNLYPSQGEKECAACLLMIKLHIKDTCSDCWPLKRWDDWINSDSRSYGSCFFWVGRRTVIEHMTNL